MYQLRPKEIVEECSPYEFLEELDEWAVEGFFLPGQLSSRTIDLDVVNSN